MISIFVLKHENVSRKNIYVMATRIATIIQMRPPAVSFLCNLWMFTKFPTESAVCFDLLIRQLESIINSRINLQTFKSKSDLN